MDTQLIGKTVLITGGTGGIGKQTAIALAKMGARLFISGRSVESGKAAVEEIIYKSGNNQVDLLAVDLLVQKGVHSLFSQLAQRVDRLDVLINNAGLAAQKRVITVDGVEANFAMNVLTPYLLTQLCMDLLMESGHGRVINLAGGEARGSIELDNLQAERSFQGLVSYSHAKLIMMAMSLEFAARLRGVPVTVNVCYPGQASTAMTRSVTREMLPGWMAVLWPVFKSLIREDGGVSAEKASRSSVFLASSKDVEGITGKFYDTNCSLSSWPKSVMDEDNRRTIWQLLETCAGLDGN